MTITYDITEYTKQDVLEKIKQLRQKHNYSCANVAAGIGYETQKGYYDLERGKTSIKLEHLVKLAIFYQVSIDSFFKKQ